MRTLWICYMLHLTIWMMHPLNCSKNTASLTFDQVFVGKQQNYFLLPQDSNTPTKSPNTPHFSTKYICYLVTWVLGMEMSCGCTTGHIARGQARREEESSVSNQMGLCLLTAIQDQVNNSLYLVGLGVSHTVLVARKWYKKDGKGKAQR